VVSCNLVLLFGLNIGGPKRYGEFEFWFSILKIILILGLILMTVVLMCGGNPKNDAFGFRYWKNPGPARPYIAQGPQGYFLAFWSMFKTAAFTIGGPDFIAITSAETINPRRLVPKCIQRVVYHICFLYILCKCPNY
jgi:amino acid transporter